jgi:hypothetical protein
LATIPADTDLDVQNKSRQAGRPTARNVVQIAREFHQHLMRPEVKGYKQIAEQFGVTKASVSHYLSILRRLPQGFVEWLGKCDDSVILAYLTERRLRPVTRLPRSEQIRWLREVATKIGGSVSDLDELREVLSGYERPLSRGRTGHAHD